MDLFRRIGRGSFVFGILFLLVAPRLGAEEVPDPTVAAAAEAVIEHRVIPGRKGWELVTDKPPRFEILLNIPATQLTLFENGKPVRHHQVSVGTPRWPTPTGKFNIYEIQWNPWWLPPPSDWAKDAQKTPPGPGNPLYPVKLVMEQALRIHGTPSAWSIGRAASHGCMRMRRNEVRSLAEYLESKLVPNHDPAVFEEYRKKVWQPYTTKLDPGQQIWVYMVYQPLERWSNALVLHPNFYGRRIPYDEQILDLLMESGVYAAPIDLGKFHEIQKRSRGSTIIPFRDLVADDADPESLPDAFAAACQQNESIDALAKVRQTFNTHLVPTVVPIADNGAGQNLPHR